MKFDAHGRALLRAKRDPEIEEIDRARRRLWRESKDERQCHFEIVVSQSRVSEGKPHSSANGNAPLADPDTIGGSTPDFKQK